MLHHPFDSFVSVETFLKAAVRDPHVVTIKLTLYRIGYDSPLIDLLEEAAEAGKQVAVLVELKARFDERNNITWATRLEAAGVHVVYGLVNLKTHCKLCLVIRKEPDGIRRYAHIGTGNYNASTARVYTDVALVTARPTIVDDVTNVFNYLTGYSGMTDYQELLVAPVSLRRRLYELIERERAHAAEGRPARIVFKINSITDTGMIQELYRASQAGVRIDLIVRGICCLRPGIPGVSERISVRSIVGRFLEHSRIYSFENGGDPQAFIGSADLMERNLDRRVEVLCPVLDRSLLEYLRETVLGAVPARHRSRHRARHRRRLHGRQPRPKSPIASARRTFCWGGTRRTTREPPQRSSVINAVHARRTRSSRSSRRIFPRDLPSAGFVSPRRSAPLDQLAQHFRRDEPAERALALRREDREIDPADRALLERERHFGADQVRGQLAHVRLVADERDARLPHVLAELLHDGRRGARRRQRIGIGDTGAWTS